MLVAHELGRIPRGTHADSTGHQIMRGAITAVLLIVKVCHVSRAGRDDSLARREGHCDDHRHVSTAGLQDSSLHHMSLNV